MRVTPQTSPKIAIPRRGKLRARRVADFLERLTVPTGFGAGKQFRVRDWQYDYLEDVYGNVDVNGVLVTRYAILSMGRKNGKTALDAGLVLVHLVGPESVENGEVYSAATEKEQAGQIFKFCRQYVASEPELQAHVSTFSTKTMNCSNGSMFRALSREAGSKMGMSPSAYVYDELAQAKNRDLFDALDTGMGAREEPLAHIISTQSNDPQHPLSELIDDGLAGHDPSIVVHLYSVPDEEKNIFTERVWYFANPALGDFKSLKDMRQQAARASRRTSFENSFRNLQLNQRVNQQDIFIPRSEWIACATKRPIPDGAQCWAAGDLSSVNDLTALTLVTDGDEDNVEQYFWKPEDTLLDHEDRDRKPYDAWRKGGFLETCPGRSIDYDFIAKRWIEILSRVKCRGLCFDRWRIEHLFTAFDRLGFKTWVDGKDEVTKGGLRLIPFGQGFHDMAPALDATERSITERSLSHPDNPVLNFCVSNAISVADPAGNRKLDKSKVRFRIDGAVTLAMAVGLKARERKDKKLDLSGFLSNPVSTANARR